MTAEMNETNEIARRKSKENTRASAIVEVVFSLGFLWLVNTVPQWDLGFVKGSYVGVLWALNLTIGTKIVGHGLLIVDNPQWGYRVIKLVTSITDTIAALMLWAVFPFDFSATAIPWLNRFGKIFFLIVTAGGVVGTIINGVKLLGSSLVSVFRRRRSSED